MALKLPLGVQTFEDVIKGGYVYIDKTALIHQLANDGKYYFLSRPRRFGKSLLLSTLDAYFSGRSDLFRGLAMEQLESEWPTHPVLRLDLNTGDYDGNIDALHSKLVDFLENQERIFGVGARGDSLGDRFGNLIQDIHDKTGKQVVVLVDEYDKPLIANVERDKADVQSRLRGMLKAFYGNVKTMDSCIRFALFTGVSRFSHVSIFSDLNNLTIKAYDRRTDTYTLGLPNLEVKQAFSQNLLPIYSRIAVALDDATRNIAAWQRVE